jgi:hypothetical protein
MKISDPIDELTPMIHRMCDTMANTLSLFIKRLWFRGLAALSSFAFVAAFCDSAEGAASQPVDARDIHANRGVERRLLFAPGYAF